VRRNDPGQLTQSDELRTVDGLGEEVGNHELCRTVALHDLVAPDLLMDEVCLHIQILGPGMEHRVP